MLCNNSIFLLHELQTAAENNVAFTTFHIHSSHSSIYRLFFSITIIKRKIKFTFMSNKIEKRSKTIKNIQFSMCALKDNITAKPTSSSDLEFQTSDQLPQIQRSIAILVGNHI